jgi:arylsulfatase A-like enzyme
MDQSNLLLVSIDSLRADSASLFNSELQNTPYLETFSDQCTMFDSAFSQGIWTVPSHTSVFTGLYPTEHGVVTSERSLGEHPTLAEVLQDEGYDTAANFRLDWFNGGGILRGFDRPTEEHETEDETASFSQSIKNGIKRSSVLRRIARGVYRGSFRGHMHDQHVVESAIDAIESASEPFCHFVHLNDAHWPYSPTAPFHRAATDRPTWQLAWNRAYTQQKLFDEGTPSTPANSRKMAIMKDLYLGAVRQVDHHLENLISSIPDSTLDDTVVVVFGDHGEAFGEHGEIGHNAPIPEVTHVPLLICDPTGTLPQSTISETVQLVDLYPTLADLLKVDVPETNATNLVADGPPEIAYTHSGHPEDGDYLLDDYAVWASPDDYLVSNAETDEYEEHGQSDGLRERLEAHIDTLDYVPPEGQRDMDEEAERRLQDLGYLT